jgi:hypothetical protein
MDCVSLQGFRYIFHGYCIFTKFNFVIPIKDRYMETLAAAFRTMDRAIKREFNTSPTFILLDGEKGFGFEALDSLVSYTKEEGIQLQLRSADTPKKAGHAEASGKALIRVTRSLKATSNLPVYLSSEMYTTAGYLLNRTPYRSLNWSTPFEKAYGKQPSLAHLRNFGCRAFALRKHIKRTDKLSPRATIGYLVGYNSRNIFRI